MEPAEFDNFAVEYVRMHRDSIKASGEGPEYFAEYKVADMRRTWDRRNPGREPKTILDFGGGIGTSAPYLHKYFPKSSLMIADVSAKSLAIAEAYRIEGLECVHFNGMKLPFVDKCIDIALAACVFHHIPEERHIPLIRDIYRVVRPDGLFFIFEHNPWNPLTARAVNTCPFDKNAVLIAAPKMNDRMKNGGFVRRSVTYRIFVPGALRALRFVERGLTWLPLGAQYYVVGDRR